MQQAQPAEFRQFFSFPITNVPTSFWITDSRLIVIHRSGLLKSLPVALSRRIGRHSAAPKDAEVASRLAQAHREALDGKCTTWNAQIYRETTAITISPVRDRLGKIVGTIGRVEAEDFQHDQDLPHLSVNIVPSRPAAQTESDLKALANALFASSVHGICTLDTEGTVTQWNAALELLTGISSSLACGASVASIFPTFYGCDPDTFVRLARGEHLWLCDVVFRFGEGADRYFDVSLMPLLGHSQSVQGTLGIFTDVTARALAIRDRENLHLIVENLRKSLSSATRQVNP